MVEFFVHAFVDFCPGKVGTGTAGWRRDACAHPQHTWFPAEVCLGAATREDRK